MSQGGSVQFGQVTWVGPSPLKSNPRKWIHGLIVKEHHKCVGTVPSVTNPSYILLPVFSEPLSVSLPHLMASSLPRLTVTFLPQRLPSAYITGLHILKRHLLLSPCVGEDSIVWNLATVEFTKLKCGRAQKPHFPSVVFVPAVFCYVVRSPSSTC